MVQCCIVYLFIGICFLAEKCLKKKFINWKRLRTTGKPNIYQAACGQIHTHIPWVVKNMGAMLDKV